MSFSKPITDEKLCDMHFGQICKYMCPCDIETGKSHCMECIEDNHVGEGHNAIDIKDGIIMIKNKIMLNKIQQLKNLDKEIDKAAEKFNITDDNVNIIIYYLNFILFIIYFVKIE